MHGNEYSCFMSDMFLLPWAQSFMPGMFLLPVMRAVMLGMVLFTKSCRHMSDMGLCLAFMTVLGDIPEILLPDMMLKSEVPGTLLPGKHDLLGPL